MTKDRTSRGQPMIVLGDNLRKNADRCIAVLVQQPEVYARAGILVEVKSVRGDDPSRPTRQYEVVALTNERVAEILSDRADVSRLNAKGVRVRTTVSDRLCRIIRGRGNWLRVRPLKAVVTTPVLRADGSVLQARGYDATSAVYLARSTTVSVPDDPSHADAKSAIEVLAAPFKDFPFHDESHRSAFLAALLTPLVLEVTNGEAPLVVLDANAAGSGKGLLADCIGIVCSGNAPPKIFEINDAAEMKKTLQALALSGAPMAVFDNVVSVVKSAALDSALTARSIAFRVLGTPLTREVPLRTAFVITGNDVRFARRDTRRRTLYVRLESHVDTPELRSDFEHADLIAHVTAERGALLAAALTLLSAYARAGQPAKLDAWGSFETWSRWVRGALVWCGLPDPVLARDLMSEREDPRWKDLRVLVRSLAKLDDRGRGILAKRLIAKCRKPSSRTERTLARSLFRLVGGSKNDPPSEKAVGELLSAMVGKKQSFRFGERRLRVARVGRKTNEGTRWTAVSSTTSD